MNIFIDFDSTIISTEGLDALATICAKNDTNLISEIVGLTHQGMSGTITMEESLTKRIQRLHANKSDLEQLNIYLIDKISPSIEFLKEYIALNKEHVYVISGGFMDYVKPICISIGVKAEHIFANSFIFQEEHIIGYDTACPLSMSKGKATVIKELNTHNSKSFIVGDGYTDYEVKKEGAVDFFIAYTETVERQNVLSNADFICKNFKEVINTIHEQRT